MINLDQVRTLEWKVKQAVQLIVHLRRENDTLRGRLSDTEVRLQELETLLDAFKATQNEMESGIRNALEDLDNLEAVPAESPSGPVEPVRFTTVSAPVPEPVPAPVAVSEPEPAAETDLSFEEEYAALAAAEAAAAEAAPVVDVVEAEADPEPAPESVELAEDFAATEADEETQDSEETLTFETVAAETVTPEPEPEVREPEPRAPEQPGLGIF